MSYQVLARKWRPRNFKELVGQIHVLQALVNALDNNRLHHAYLFTGTRGVGKTTIARILAKCLNCEGGVTSEPCGQCSSCREIDEGRFVDLIEVDAASRTRLEDTKELLDNVQYAPTRGRFKVYLIDEVHMLSTHSFNALLKTLEEPPPHIKFLLATTDPHKLPITILSRCLQFSLKNMPPEKVVDHLQTVLKGENIPYEHPALWQLGRAADGSMRDALSLTDQAIAYCGDTLTSQGVTAMLGTIDQDQVYRVLEALASGQADALLDAVGELSEHSPDYLAVLADMLSALHRVALAQAVPDVVDNSQGDRDKILDLANRVTAEDIQLYYQTGLIGRRDLPMAPDPRAGFEMVLLRMLAFRPEGLSVSAPDQPLSAAGSSGNAPAESSVDRDEPEEPEPASVSEQKSQTAVVQSVAEPVTEPVAESVAESVIEREAPAVVPVSDSIPPAPPIEAYAEPAVDAGPVAAEAVIAEPLFTEQSSTEQSSTKQSATEQSATESVIAEQAPEPLPEQQAPAAVTQIQAETVEQAVANAPVKAPAQQAAPAPESVASEPAEKLSLAGLNNEGWIQLSQSLGLGGVTGAILSNCELLAVADGHIQLRLDHQHDTLYNETHRQRIEQALSDYFAQGINLDVQTGDIVQETPAVWRERRRQERLQEARQSFLSDDRVQAIVGAFSGRVLENTIQPVR